jgi:hypothetical protein
MACALRVAHCAAGAGLGWGRREVGGRAVGRRRSGGAHIVGTRSAWEEAVGACQCRKVFKAVSRGSYSGSLTVQWDR